MSKRDVRVAILVAAIVIALAASWIAVTAVAGPPQTSGGGTRPDGEFIAIPMVPRPNGDGCRLALLAGTLVVHPVWGVAVDGGSVPQLVYWPNGWSARRTDEGADLLDRQGRVVAHTGDEIRAAGGLAEFGGRDDSPSAPTVCISSRLSPRVPPGHTPAPDLTSWMVRRDSGRPR